MAQLLVILFWFGFFFGQSLCAWPGYTEESQYKKINPAVEALDMKAYLGLWYEIYTNKYVVSTFGRDDFCATANYGDNGDGTISVYNHATKNSPTGRQTDISGYAYRPYPNIKPGQFQVHFTSRARETSSSYWVLGLGPIKEGKYEWSIVSDRFSITLFVLARDPKKFHALYERDVKKLLKQLDYSEDEIVPIYQDTDCRYASVIRAEEIELQSVLQPDMDE